MSLETSLSAFIAAVGADVKNNRISIGDLTTLTTTQKANLVSALNELKGEVSTLQGQIVSSSNINDAGAPTSTTETYSISKILDSINTSIVAVKADILGSAPAALDTLQELAEALSSNPSFATDIATAIGNRVRFDEAQTLTAAQQLRARQNIGAASQVEFATLQTDLGNVNTDFLAVYNTAKA